MEWVWRLETAVGGLFDDVRKAVMMWIGKESSFDRRSRSAQLLGPLGVAAVSAAALGAGAGDAHAAFPGEDGRIAYVKDGAIFSVDPDGSDKARLTDPRRSSERDDFDQHPMYAPDGDEIVFVRTSCRPECDRADVFLVDDDGSDRRRLTSGDGFEVFASFSPSGRKIALVRDEKVLKMRKDGGGVERLTEDIEADQAVWSPLGDEIAFNSSSTGGSPSDVYKVDTDGGPLTNLTQTPDVYEEAPDWSPDGQKIVAECGPQLCSVSPEGYQAPPIDVGSTSEGRTQPAYSPSGDRIAFADQEDDDDDHPYLKTILPNGSDPRDTERFGNQASWQPR